MQKQFNCTVIAFNNQHFEVKYQSTQVLQEDGIKPINIIREVRFSDYVLSLGQLRERTVWHQIMDAVDNNSYSAWEKYHKENTSDHVHEVFYDAIKATVANNINRTDQIEDIHNISQQGQQC